MCSRHASRRPAAAMAALFVVFLAGRAEAQLGRVTGRVFDAETRQPLQGATVVAESAANLSPKFTVVTDEKGQFAVLGLRSGVWVFTASAPGYEPQKGAGRFRALGSNPPIEFRLSRVDVPEPLPLEGIDTRLLQQELSTAQSLLAAGQFDEAVAAYTAVLDKAPALTMVNVQIGRAYRAKKDYANAIAAYGKVLEADPENELARLELGLTELERGNVEGAERALTEAASSTEATSAVFCALGDVKFAAGRHDEAVAWYRKAAEADPAWARPHLKLGLVAVNAGDKSAAIEAFEKVIALDATSAEAGQARSILEQLKP